MAIFYIILPLLTVTMTTITIDESVSLRTTHFRNINDLYEALYEEQLEQKLQNAKATGVFIDA